MNKYRLSVSRENEHKKKGLGLDTTLLKEQEIFCEDTNCCKNQFTIKGLRILLYTKIILVSHFAFLILNKF
jgi:hypothetical protein